MHPLHLLKKAVPLNFDASTFYNAFQISTSLTFEETQDLLTVVLMSEKEFGKLENKIVEMIGSEDGSVELVLLDPMGHSQILHDDANSRDLTDDELSKLQTGPSVPVFKADDL